MSSQGVSFRADILGMPNSTASPKDSALVIIDAQNEYALGKLKVSNVESSRKAIKALLDKYRSEGGASQRTFDFCYLFRLAVQPPTTRILHAKLLCVQSYPG